ncbi:hypothetical protein HMN09_00736900 [Mycena chlorophos]|uniref:DUF7918 domain-containing protein n=1 Tax=Mycena chlorophos TaxID=658473 RepID=A0A8H6WAZ3_MYCCL|nr:hypothetical protein HMN09_00736900 [Mycena chlorophos]
MELNGFSASVVIEDKIAAEYAVQVDNGGKTATCWIASEVGKPQLTSTHLEQNFYIMFSRTSYAEDVKGTFYVDGEDCGAKILSKESESSTIYKRGVKETDGMHIRAFAFAALRTTDDDAYLDKSLPRSLGEIRLQIVPVKSVKLAKPTTPRRTQAGSPTAKRKSPVKSTCTAANKPLLSPLSLHERSLKLSGLTQSVSLSPAQSCEPEAKMESIEAGPPVVTFVIKYRAPGASSPTKRKARSTIVGRRRRSLHIDDSDSDSDTIDVVKPKKEDSEPEIVQLSPALGCTLAAPGQDIDAGMLDANSNNLRAERDELEAQLEALKAEHAEIARRMKEMAARPGREGLQVNMLAQPAANGPQHTEPAGDSGVQQCASESLVPKAAAVESPVRQAVVKGSSHNPNSEPPIGKKIPSKSARTRTARVRHPSVDLTLDSE